ncbi:fimbrial biogenesis chaperone [Serratia sp. L9]|uniref:fimbrial biogenesis chaperone n=1 Tax=Serratia sp. L9 TaxID=3423946 RepID=UPI003D67CD3A
MAFRTRVKLFYRPANLSGEANDAPEKLQWSYVAGGVKVKNPTPFYVSFTEINAITNQKKSALASHGDMLAPGQEKHWPFPVTVRALLTLSSPQSMTLVAGLTAAKTSSSNSWKKPQAAARCLLTGGRLIW